MVGLRAWAHIFLCPVVWFVHCASARWQHRQQQRKRTSLRLFIELAAHRDFVRRAFVVSVNEKEARELHCIKHKFINKKSISHHYERQQLSWQQLLALWVRRLSFSLSFSLFFSPVPRLLIGQINVVIQFIVVLATTTLETLSPWTLRLIRIDGSLGMCQIKWKSVDIMATTRSGACTSFSHYSLASVISVTFHLSYGPNEIES